MIRLSPSSSAGESPVERTLLPPIAAEQRRTRDKIFNTLGKGVDITLDSSEFLVESALYATGRTVLAGARGIKASVEGVMGKPYRHAR